jgi:hypothetical protein
LCEPQISPNTKMWRKSFRVFSSCDTVGEYHRFKRTFWFSCQGEVADDLQRQFLGGKTTVTCTTLRVESHPTRNQEWMCWRGSSAAIYQSWPRKTTTSTTKTTKIVKTLIYTRKVLTVWAGSCKLMRASPAQSLFGSESHRIHDHSLLGTWRRATALLMQVLLILYIEKAQTARKTTSSTIIPLLRVYLLPRGRFA